MQDSYTFSEPLTTDQVYAMLKKAATATDSILQYSLNITHNFDPKLGVDKSWANKSGHFRNSDVPSGINFLLEEAIDEESEKLVQFRKIQFNRFELQEFNEGGKLGEYVNTLVSEIDKACKERT